MYVQISLSDYTSLQPCATFDGRIDLWVIASRSRRPPTQPYLIYPNYPPLHVRSTSLLTGSAPCSPLGYFATVVKRQLALPPPLPSRTLSALPSSASTNNIWLIDIFGPVHRFQLLPLSRRLPAISNKSSIFTLIQQIMLR